MDIDKLEELLLKMIKDYLKDNSDEFINLIFCFISFLNFIKVKTPHNKIPTSREEGNVITAFCFRNTLLEDIHAGAIQFGNITMKKLMQESSWKLTEWLIMRETLLKTKPEFYHFIVNGYEVLYTKEWDK